MIGHKGWRTMKRSPHPAQVAADRQRAEEEHLRAQQIEQDIERRLRSVAHAMQRYGVTNEMVRYYGRELMKRALSGAPGK